MRSLRLLIATGICSATTFVNAEDVASGSVLLASAEGVSVFERDGAMTFGKFATALVDGKPGALGRSDMIYDGWKLASGNYLCSSHHFVRELTPDGKTLWEFRVKAPVELKTYVPLPNGDVMTVDADAMELVQLTDKGQRVAKRIPVPTDKKASLQGICFRARRTGNGQNGDGRRGVRGGRKVEL